MRAPGLRALTGPGSGGLQDFAPHDLVRLHHAFDGLAGADKNMGVDPQIAWISAYAAVQITRVGA